MPTYSYKCNDCNTKYDVFHKTIKFETKVKCPSCESDNSQKLMSVSNFGGFSSNKTFEMPKAPSCSSGMCGLN